MPLVCSRTKWCDVRAIRIYWVRCNTTVIARKEGFAFDVFCRNGVIFTTHLFWFCQFILL